ncbi:Uncharacterised protein [Mycobacteroides abscessus subsp. abscessus]|nr:Uncharacterised protein [Mycobacteroides abscessus]SHY18956.1 Uncharacterised protein [Mycobacteroides abscessus subsp. abscessus]CPS49727.1 Uncharacterised protein [Mycobacteroides abscessus]CPT30839.1 Uncharacterised protein [Mycobacteroides abscessus]CPU43033.1 Uncharacterised protein [Mycobacteroides abscessus]
MTFLDDTSGPEHTRPTQAQLSPLDGVISSRARLGVWADEMLWFVEQVSQSYEVRSRGECFGHALKLERLGDKDN